MKRRKILKVLAYLVCSLLLASVLVVWRFPYHTLELKLEALASEHLGVELAISDLSYSFPLGLKSPRCLIRPSAPESSPPIELTHVYLSLRVLALLKKAVSVKVGAMAYGGSLEADLVLRNPNKLRNRHVRMNWQSIQLERHPALPQLLGRRITGEISGTLQLDGSGDEIAAYNGTGKLQLVKGSSEVKSPYLKVNTVDDLQVDADIMLHGERLEIVSCQFKARGLRGSLVGVVKLRSTLSESELDLRGRGKMDATFVDPTDPTGRAAYALLKQNRLLPFHLRGTAKSPDLRLF